MADILKARDIRVGPRPYRVAFRLTEPGAGYRWYHCEAMASPFEARTIARAVALQEVANGQRTPFDLTDRGTVFVLWETN